MPEPSVIWLRGENGAVHEFELPLHEAIQDRLTKGYLTQVNEDGTDYIAPEDQGSDLTKGLPARPAVNASKAEWVGFVVHAYGIKPDKAETATKQDLIDMVNNLQGAARDAGTSGNPARSE